jgi:hypothetical protein
MTYDKFRADIIVAFALMVAIVLAVTAISARADGPPPQGFRPGLYPQAVPRPQGSPSCVQTAIQLGYLTGRRELAYSATEACIAFTGATGVQLPYGYYGPYVPSGWVPPGWALPIPY